MPQLDTSTYESQIFWLVITLGIVYLFVARFAVPRIGEMMAERDQRNAARLEEVQRIHDECKEVQEIAKRLRATANAEAEKIRQVAVLEADEEYRRALVRAKADVDEMIQEASQQIDALRSEVESNMLDSIVEVASEMISQTTLVSADKRKLKSAVKQRLADLETRYVN